MLLAVSRDSELLSLLDCACFSRKRGERRLAVLREAKPLLRRGARQGIAGEWMLPMLLLLQLLVLACLALPLLISLASNIWRNLHVLRAVPGPQSVFSLRTLLLGVFGDGTLGEAGMPLRHRTYATLQKSYGPIMRICISPLFARMAVLVCDPAEPIPKWMSRADSDRGNFWHSVQLHRSIFALPMGPDWARHRKLIAPLFSVKSLTTFVPQMSQFGQEALILSLRGRVSSWIAL